MSVMTATLDAGLRWDCGKAVEKQHGGHRVLCRLRWRPGKKQRSDTEAPQAEEAKPAGLRLKQQVPESLSGNPMLERHPEPPRRQPRRRIPWGKIVILLLLVAAAAAAIYYLPGVLDGGDLRVWERAKQWVEAHESPPDRTRALSDLRDIVLTIDTDEGNREARAGLMALYGLGALHVGNPKGWRGTIGALEREADGSSFIGLVRDVKLDDSVQVKCSRCGGDGKCASCGGTGKSAAIGLAPRAEADRREIGRSLDDRDAPTKPCPVCGGTGKCPRCNGRGKVTVAARQPVPDEADLKKRWDTAREKTARLVGVHYWKIRGVRELGRVKDMVTPDGPRPAPDSDREATNRPASPSTPMAAAEEGPKELSELRAVFHRKKESIEQDYIAGISSWSSAYTGALEQVKAHVQEEGNLEAWDAVEAERRRFMETASISGSLEDALPALTALRERYRALRDDYATTRDEKITVLTEMYVEHLNGLQQAYVRDGKIEQARVVREEIARVEGM